MINVFRLLLRCKYSANRAAYKTNPFIFMPEMQPIFEIRFKYSANRATYKTNPFIFMPEMQPIFEFRFKYSANRATYKLLAEKL
jgi:membrane-bound metal-dependent hydrolase YbcI (DUF457 family)